MLKCSAWQPGGLFGLQICPFIVQHQSERNPWHLCKGHKRFTILCCDLTIHFKVRWISLVWEMFYINIGREMIIEALWALRAWTFSSQWWQITHEYHGCVWNVCYFLYSAYPLLFRFWWSMLKIRDHMSGPSKCHILCNLTFLLPTV